MNDVVGINIRAHREDRAWTQEHLADAAGVNVRTVQRAEDGRGISAETLQAIAGALDVAIELLRFDPAAAFGVAVHELTPELIEEKRSAFERQQQEARERLEQTHVVLKLRRVAASADFEDLVQALGMVFECGSDEDSVRDAAAELQQQLMDLLDMAQDLSPVARREQERYVFDWVRHLNTLDCDVSVALHARHVRFEVGDAMDMPTYYVVVTPRAETREYLAIERVARTQFM